MHTTVRRGFPLLSIHHLSFPFPSYLKVHRLLHTPCYMYNLHVIGAMDLMISLSIYTKVVHLTCGVYAQPVHAV